MSVLPEYLLSDLKRIHALFQLPLITAACNKCLTQRGPRICLQASVVFHFYFYVPVFSLWTLAGAKQHSTSLTLPSG